MKPPKEWLEAVEKLHGDPTPVDVQEIKALAAYYTLHDLSVLKRFQIKCKAIFEDGSIRYYEKNISAVTYADAWEIAWHLISNWDSVAGKPIANIQLQGE